MKQEELKVFIQGVMNYFKQFDNAEPVVGVPYPQHNDFVFLDYTGAIGISGARKGCIYVTASLEMLNDLIKAMNLGDAGEELRLDAIGEVANNISGNAENFFGQNFQISVPMVITGPDHNVHLPIKMPVFTIPFEWKSHKTYLVVGTE
jgi:chemotaxis protein CheX